MGFLNNVFNTIGGWFGGDKKDQQQQQSSSPQPVQQQSQAAAPTATPISQLNGRESNPNAPQKLLNLQPITSQPKPVTPQQPQQQPAQQQPWWSNALKSVGSVASSVASGAQQLGTGALYGFDNGLRGIAKDATGLMGDAGLPGARDASLRMQGQINQQQNYINNSKIAQVGANVGGFGDAVTAPSQIAKGLGIGINAAGTAAQPIVNNNQTLNNAANYATLSPAGKNVIMPALAGFAAPTLNRTGLQSVSDTQGNAVNANSDLKAFGIQPIQAVANVAGDPLTYMPFGKADTIGQAALQFGKAGAISGALNPANNLGDWLTHTGEGAVTGAAAGVGLHGAGQVAGPLLQKAAGGVSDLVGNGVSALQRSAAESAGHFNVQGDIDKAINVLHNGPDTALTQSIKDDFANRWSRNLSGFRDDMRDATQKLGMPEYYKNLSGQDLKHIFNNMLDSTHVIPKATMNNISREAEKAGRNGFINPDLLTGGLSSKMAATADTPANLASQPLLKVPQTVGDIAQQASTQGGVHLPDTAFNADMRTNAAAPSDNIDVPTFLRQNAQQIQQNSASKIADINRQIATIQQGNNPQVQKFQDAQAIANAYKESPSKGQAMAKIVSTRNQRVDPAGDIQALMQQRAGAVADANAARSAGQAQGALDVNGLNPSEVSSGIHSVNPNQEAEAAAPALKQQADAAAQQAAATPPPPPNHQGDLEAMINGGASKQAVQEYLSGLPLSQQQEALASVKDMLPHLPDETKMPTPAPEPTAQTATPAPEATPAPAPNPEATPPLQAQQPAATNPSDAPPADPRQQLIDGLAAASNQSASDVASLAAARSQRAAQALSASNGLTGQAATDARLAAMGGSMNHRGTYTGIGGDNASQIFDALRIQAQNNPDLANKPNTLTNLELALSKAVQGTDLKGNVVGAPTPGEINLIKQYFGDNVATAVDKAVSNSQTIGQKAMAIAGNIAAVPKSLMATFDASATLRQGGVLATRFPKIAAHAAVEQIKYMANPEYFRSAMQEIENSPRYTQAVQSGLSLSGVQSLDQAEEQFVGKLVGKIPGIAASERGYAGFLTKLRMDTFNQIMDKAEAGGQTMPAQDVASVANFINTASGRGDLGHFFENHATTLTTALFSPRLWASRLQMLNPMYYAGLSGPARTYALQSAATFAGTAAAVLGMAKLGGAAVSTDPRSSDFLKIRYGNNRYDILGGFQQNLVFAARELTGESVSSTTGAVNKFAPGVTDIGNQNGLLAKSKFGGLDRVKVLTDLVDNKANPLIAAGARIASGKGIGGKPVDVLGELSNLVTPLGISGAISTAQDQGNLSLSDPLGSAKTLAKGALLNSPDLLGISAQNYGDIPTKYQPASQAKNPIPVPPDVQKVLDKQQTVAKAADFKSRGVPFYTDNGFDKAVQARTEQGQYDKAIEGLQSKLDNASKNPDIPASDLADQKDAITRLNVAKSGNIKPNIISQYVGAGKDGVSLAEWRNLGDPTSDTYNPKLYQDLYSYDSALAKAGVSKNSVSGSDNFYTAKTPAKGSKTNLSNGNLLGSVPNLGKITLGNLSARSTGVSAMPVIPKLSGTNLVQKRQISVSRVQ